MTIDKSLLGARVRMIEGHRETIVKITRQGYVTEKNSLITPDCIKPSGRGYKEVEAPAAEETYEDQVIEARRAARKASRLARKQRKAEAAAAAAAAATPKASGISRKENSTKPAAADSSPRGRRAPKATPEAVADPVRLKKVVKITQAISEEVRDSIETQLATILKRTGYNFTAALIGAKYTDNSLSIEIGLLPTAATSEDILEYRSLYETTWDEAGDEGEEGGEEEGEEEGEGEGEGEGEDSLEEIESSIEEDIEAGIELVAEVTGIEESQAKKFVTAWYENADVIEEKLDNEFAPGVTASNESGHEVIVVGYSTAKEKVVVFDAEADKLVGLTFGQMAKYSVEEDAQDNNEEDDAL